MPTILTVAALLIAAAILLAGASGQQPSDPLATARALAHTHVTDADRRPRIDITVKVNRKGFWVLTSDARLNGESRDSADLEGLRATLADIDRRYPGGQRVILKAADDVPFTMLIDTIDTARQVTNPDGTMRSMPREIIFAPAFE
jgi:hypothetical protein